MITSPHNPRVKAARALQQRRQREKLGQMLVEGLRLVGDAMAAGLQPATLFYTQSAADDPRLTALIAEAGRAAEAVSDELFESLAETVTPQGVVAVFPQPAFPWPEAPTLLLVCDGVRDPGNLGTLIRAAAGAGVEGILLPKGAVDAWSPKVLRAAMGAHFRLPLRANLLWPEIEQALVGLQVRLAEGGTPTAYDQVDWTVPSALIVGGEAEGAGPEARARTDTPVSIPLARDVESLNAAMAGSIILFEAQRQRRSQG